MISVTCVCLDEILRFLSFERWNSRIIYDWKTHTQRKQMWMKTFSLSLSLYLFCVEHSNMVNKSFGVNNQMETFSFWINVSRIIIIILLLLELMIEYINIYEKFKTINVFAIVICHSILLFTLTNMKYHQCVMQANIILTTTNTKFGVDFFSLNILNFNHDDDDTNGQ